MAAYDINASVDPSIRRVTEGEDAIFSCNVSGDDVGNVDIAFNWVAHHSVISEQRFQTTNEGQGFRILSTTAAENNTDVTCSVRSFQTKEVLTSGKSRLVVMPPVAIVQPITSPQHLTATVKSTTKQTTAGPTPTTLVRHETQTPRESAGETAQTGSQEGMNVAILSGAIVGAIALSLVFLVAVLTLMRSRKRRKLAQRASFSGSRAGRNTDGVPHMKRYEFLDPNSGEKMAFSESGGFAPESPRKQGKGCNQANQEMLRTCSRGSAPDILASCGVEDNASFKQSIKRGQHSNESLAQHFYESITPTYIVPGHTSSPDDHSYTDINIGQANDDLNDNNKLEVTNNLKNSTNGLPLDRFGYVELNIEPQNLNLSSEDLVNSSQTENTPCLPTIHDNPLNMDSKC